MISEIKVNNLTHTFGKGSPEALTVLDGITLDFPSGSFTSIVGTSGCGKSTLLKMMAGLFDPSDGEMTLDVQATKRHRVLPTTSFGARFLFWRPKAWF